MKLSDILESSEKPVQHTPQPIRPSPLDVISQKLAKNGTMSYRPSVPPGPPGPPEPQMYNNPNGGRRSKLILIDYHRHPPMSNPGYPINNMPHVMGRSRVQAMPMSADQIIKANNSMQAQKMLYQNPRMGPMNGPGMMPSYHNFPGGRGPNA